MGNYSAYLDASGSVADHACRIFTIAGYVGTDQQWATFGLRWQEVLNVAGVTHFHMKDFAQSRGEFKAWKRDEARRAKFLGDLIAIVKNVQLKDFGTSLNMDDYRRADKVFKITESLGAYAMIASATIGAIEGWHKTCGSGDSLSLFLEKGDAQQNTLRTIALKTGLDEGRKPIFIKKKWVENGSDRYCLPMQASDLLAYEQAKCLTDRLSKGKSNARESLFQLSQSRIGPVPLTWCYLEHKFLLASCDFFNVPRRE